MNTTIKTCFKCDEPKRLSEFYRHKRMGDGHLNKCKECTKTDVMEHRRNNLERIQAYDRMRYRRDGYRQRQIRMLNKRRPRHVRLVHTRTGNAIRDGRLIRPEGCWHCGTKCIPDAHHVYYDLDRPLDVTWLCRSCHITAHKMTA